MVQVTDAHAIYQYLLQEGIVVRDRSKVTLCEGSLRITVGTAAENEVLVNALKKYTS
ncbi:aminotransferase class I/II-fold pyridoxal phosphate-dependent enzyme [Paraflavitalea speifideaquila]|uniref:aminotransferase class I/II-fold pyridoxal phosphate-dependent enzyme n=1 Tax=Paraflavitalea speifideaquila TaxID=3076558 RepID=UPI0028E56E26|nr:aminotransferase class I/II-fold pyridoxal phosphate-dependent enzyme [Paraflavitalea speifideiaquila]